MFRACFVFSILVVFRAFARLFYRIEVEWIGGEPTDAWGDYRLISILNHTSLFETLYAGAAPLSFMWRIARQGVIPVADKTLKRPMVGKFFRWIGREVIPLTRERDQSWDQVISRVAPDSMIMLLPEGRMKRADGLDSQGRPMTVRGGIADLLRSIPRGRMLLAYSAGLHHVHVPGQRLPRLFKTIWIRFEAIDIPAYCETIRQQRSEKFKIAVIRDLEERRNRWCHPPVELHTGASLPLVPPGGGDSPSLVDEEGDRQRKDEEDAAQEDGVL